MGLCYMETCGECVIYGYDPEHQTFMSTHVLAAHKLKYEKPTATEVKSSAVVSKSKYTMLARQCEKVQ